jgi:hypothetical protein
MFLVSRQQQETGGAKTYEKRLIAAQNHMKSSPNRPIQTNRANVVGASREAHDGPKLRGHVELPLQAVPQHRSLASAFLSAHKKYAPDEMLFTGPRSAGVGRSSFQCRPQDLTRPLPCSTTDV